MNCEYARRLLDVSLDDALPDDDRGVLAAHLDACDACREEADASRRALDALRGAAPGRASASEVAAVLAAVDGAAAGRSGRRRAAAWLGPVLGAAAALLVTWLLGWLAPGGERSSPETSVELPVADADPGPEDADPAPPVADGEPSPVVPPPVVSRPAPRLVVDTAPLARLGARVWADASARADEALEVLREQVRLARERGATTAVEPALAAAPTPAGPDAAATVTPAALAARPPEPAAAPPRVSNAPRPGRVDVFHDGGAVRLRVSGTVREVVPTLLTLLEQGDDDVAAVARARLEAYRAELAARPDVGPELEQALAEDGATGSWWEELFAARDVSADGGQGGPDDDLDRWSRWWAAAEPLLPPDPAEGAA